MFSQNVIVESAVRWSLVGAAVGAAGGALKGLMAKGRARTEDEHRARLEGQGGGLADLDFDPDVAAAVGALADFRQHHPESFANLRGSALALAKLNVQAYQDPAPGFALSTHASKACSAMIEGVRSLRAHYVDTRPPAQGLEQFDEAAGGVQKLCNDYMHNITLTVQSKK